VAIVDDGKRYLLSTLFLLPLSLERERETREGCCCLERYVEREAGENGVQEIEHWHTYEERRRMSRRDEGRRIEGRSVKLTRW